MTSVGRILSPGASEFFQEYVHPCRPVVIDGLLNGSGAFERWSIDDLRERVGDRKVPVELPFTANIFGDPATGGPSYEWMRVAEFLDDVRTSRGVPRRYLAALDLEKVFPELQADLPKPVCLECVYCTKTALSIGPGGHVTPLHYDLYDSLVFMIQGRKTWTLLPPEQTSKVYPRAFPACHYSQVDVENPDLNQFPDFAGARRFVVQLRRGEALFVPGGWWHHVHGHGVNIAVSTMWLPPVVPAPNDQAR